MIDKLTPEQEAMIPTYVDKWIALQTVDQPYEDIKDVISKVWKECGEEAPEVIMCESPTQAAEMGRKESPSGKDEEGYYGYWSLLFNCGAAMYDFAKAIGEAPTEEKMNLFVDWVRCCPFVYVTPSKVFVAKKPVSIHWNEGRLHNESGMAVEYPDKTGIYSINGVTVDEQIVMRPETQTVEQIKEEQNEEVKRLRIERYGWGNYFDGIGAVLVDERRNDIEGTNEYLMVGDNMKALLCICPSTGKQFVLEVPPDTKDCRSAQAWLSNGMSERIITAS